MFEFKEEVGRLDTNACLFQVQSSCLLEPCSGHWNPYDHCY